MKAQAQSSYFQRKNTKRGMALSTAMAISIVLAIFVALLVSMATLNITTTQVTVSQREAYITAKSAIAFAESYYATHDDQIPGYTDNYGEAVMLFGSEDVSAGAEVYITKKGMADSSINSDDVDAMKNQDSVPVYVEVINTGATLDLTACCKYSNGDIYTLTKEFDYRDASTTTEGNNFTGNIVYEIGSDTRYLRIHVRTSAAFDYEPYLYSWATTVDSDSSGTSKYSSSIVNHAVGTSGRTVNLTGDWIVNWDNADLAGPQGAMIYEGNGWYIYEIPIGADVNINTISAIVSRKGAWRMNESATVSQYDVQTWELFGIPVPSQTGKENGLDVYFTLNSDKFQDALVDYGRDPIDDLTRYYKEQSANPTTFAQWATKYYSLYTKTNSYTIHVRDINTYNASGAGSGLTYEGYGWFRDTTSNSGEYIDINGTRIYYSSGGIVSQNEYGKEVIRELFVCVNGSDVATFQTEAEANEYFVANGDTAAADYVTVYAKGNNQPINSVNNPKISYKYDEYETSVTPPEPPASTGADDSDLEKELTSETTETGDTPTPASKYYVISNIFADSAMYDISSTDEEGNTVEKYESVVYNVAPGTYKFRVRDDTDYASKTIKDVYIGAVSTITFTFTPSADGGEGTLTYTVTPTGSTTLAAADWKYVGFYNDKLTNQRNSSQKTDFTDSTWEHIYVNYILSDGTLNSYEINTVNSSFASVVWGKIPKDAKTIYFSNMSYLNYTDADYERTDEIDSTKFKSVVNPVFVPMEKDGGKWTVGDNDLYTEYTTKLKTSSGNATMVYAGTNKIAYYDIPIVNLLDLLVKDKTGSTGNHVFTHRLWSGGYGFNGKNYTFDSGNYVMYQGEKYYYTTSNEGKSFLILNDDTTDAGSYAWTNDFAMNDMANAWGSIGKYMDNRFGGTFTSSGSYYNGESSPSELAYNYVPSWYTYKIPVVSQYSIGNVTNMNGSGTIDFKLTDIPVAKSAEGEYINQPIYLDYDGSTGVYTYNTDEGRVDTSSNNKVRVYYDNTEGWSDVYCYVYGVETAKNIKLNEDTSDGETSYYSLEFDAGKYAYFIFNDGSLTESDNKTIKSSCTERSELLYLTGEEDSSRACKILARGKATEFEYYLHPRTKALYAWNEIRSAANESSIYMSYSYDAVTKQYTAIGSAVAMSNLEAKMADAENYYNIGSGGANPYWVSGGSTGADYYTDLASAVRGFVSSIKDARVYLDGYNGYVFPEGAYRDSAVDYDTPWLSSLAAAYENAISVYTTNAAVQTNAAELNSLANEINIRIANPSIIISANAAQVIIDNRDGGWAKENIHLYYQDSAGNWQIASQTLYSTSETGYYAYVFLLGAGTSYDATTNFAISSAADIATLQAELTADPAVATTVQAVSGGCRFYFSTDTKKWEVDNSLPRKYVADDTITEGGTNTEWGLLESPMAKSDFELYFRYDTVVTYNNPSGSGVVTYTIPAGTYKISTNYPGFTTDIDPSRDNYGINLFSNNAKDYLTNPLKFGMNESSSTYGSFNVWNADYSETKSIDIMCSSIDGERKAVSSKNVSLRTKNATGDSLTVNDSVLLEGKAVSIAVNDLQLNADFTIKSKSITFYTDVEVTCPDGSNYTIPHGTWIFNSSSSVSTAEINLTSKDWMDHYVLVATAQYSITGGTYVAK